MYFKQDRQDRLQRQDLTMTLFALLILNTSTVIVKKQIILESFVIVIYDFLSILLRGIK